MCLYSSVNGEEPVHIFNEENFWTEVQNYVNVAEEEISESFVIESRTLEVFSRLVKALVCRHTKRLARRPAMENSFKITLNAKFFELVYYLCRL